MCTIGKYSKMLGIAIKCVFSTFYAEIIPNFIGNLHI